MAHRRIAAIVLAAGLSSRLAPHNKLLAPMPDGNALITQTARQALASAARPVIVVTGFQAPLVEAALADLPLTLVHAPDFVEGLTASLRAGVTALPSEAKAAVIMLGDMPLVEPDLLNALLAAYEPQAGADIVIPVWRGQRGNPRLWGRRYFREILSLSGDTGAGRLLAAHASRVAEITAPSDAVLRDFDTQAAFDS
jgi:molybdenum cofactor cytidylyltransferase